MALSDFALRTLYGQIILGVSPSKIEEAPAFVRHFSPIEQSELDFQYEIWRTKALSRGLHSDESKLKELDETGLWTDAEEAALENAQSYLTGLRDTKKNLVLSSQVAAQNTQIEAAEKDVIAKRVKKQELMGLTAEKFAQKKLNELHIFKSFYRDKKCTEPFYSPEEFDDLEIHELNKIAGIFNIAMCDLNDETLKRISVLPFFQNQFSLCDDNIYHFYGKPIVYLTYLQSELVGYGRFFKSILHSDPKPPEDVLKDPDKMIDWYNMSKNADKMMRSNNAANVAVVGATPEDMKNLSENHGETVSLTKMAGGKTKMRGAEFMKLLG